MTSRPLQHEAVVARLVEAVEVHQAMHQAKGER
jgi:hypothetical protein